MLLNKERALAIMKEEKLDALIATTPENVLYMTDHAGWMAWVYRGNTMQRGCQQYSILTPDGARTLITHLLIDLPYVNNCDVQVDDLWVYGPTFVKKPEGYQPQIPEEKLMAELMDSKTRRTVDSATALVGALKARGVARGRVGIEFFGLAPSVEDILRTEFRQMELVEAGEILRRIRYIKTPDEIHRLRLAALVNEKALQEVMKAIKPGVTEWEIRKVFKGTLGAQDASQDFFTCSGGLRAGVYAGISDYRFKTGDMVVIDPGCELNHYHADSGLVGVLGEPTKQQLDYWRKELDIWETGLETIGPGVTPAKVFDAMAAVQKKHFGIVGGYFGHCIGVEPREMPIINRVPGAGAKLMDMEGAPPFEPGMVFMLEIPFTIMGGYAVHIEKALVITERGWEPLIHTRHDLFTFSV